VTAPPVANPLREGLRLDRTPPPCAVVIFGASGDLTHRKLVPGLYALAAGGMLAPGFTVVGAARTEMSDEQFREGLRDGVEKHGRVPLQPEVWEGFARGLRYARVDFDAEGGLDDLKRVLAEVDRERGTGGNRVYYLSIPPSGIGTVARRLGEEGLSKVPDTDGGFCRLIVEKPFGRNLQTARELSADLHHSFAEEQIYRIDHYLGKETVQNLLVFRFANGIFEPLWTRQYIDHVQITVAESIGVEGRGAY
jgi:glucose-6-phosphate 1-dehydrogenase